MIPITVLTIYSIVLFATELATSQEFVRTYFTDIGHPPKHGYFAAADGKIGYAVNTSLSASLLAGASLLLIFACFANRKELDGQGKLLLAQAMILLYMSLDDRLMLHERIGKALGTHSTVILAMVALLNALLYAGWFRVSYFNLRMVVAFATGIGLFGVMMVFDLVIPHYMPGRLSLEDLTKVWAGYFFLRFGWEAAVARGLPAVGPREEWLPNFLKPLIPKQIRERVLS